MRNMPGRQLDGAALRRGVFSIPTLAVTLVAGALLFLTLWRVFDVDWGELWDNVSTVDPLMYAAALVLYYLSFWFRGIRWRLISRTAGLRTVGKREGAGRPRSAGPSFSWAGSPIPLRFSGWATRTAGGRCRGSPARGLRRVSARCSPSESRTWWLSWVWCWWPLPG